MPKIVLIEKTGAVKTITVKDFTKETLYKKAGFKTSEGFSLQHTWGVEDGIDHSIQLYAKKTGRAGQENKYDFPPPVDSALFFGSCLLVGIDPQTGSVVDLESDDWEEIYEYLFGGFEDVGSNDSDDEDEDEEDIDTEDELDAIKKTTGTEVKQTKQGYAKDGFIVDDDEDEEDAYESEASDASCDTPPPKKRSAKGRKPAEKQTKKQTSTVIQVQLENDLQMEECESELSEESYE